MERAARFLFLNKNSFGGFYEASSRLKMTYKGAGDFDEEHLKRWLEGLKDLGKYLQGEGIVLMCGDFKDVFDARHDADVWYLDPPYYQNTGKEYNNYVDKPFTPEDHNVLNTLMNATACAFVLSNSVVRPTTHTHITAHVRAFMTHHVHMLAHLPSPANRSPPWPSAGES